MYRIPAIFAAVSIYEDWKDSKPAHAIVEGNFRMSLGESSIWVDWHDVQTYYNLDSTVDYSVTLDHGMMFNKQGFVLRHIDISAATIPPYDCSSFVGAWKNDTLCEKFLRLLAPMSIRMPQIFKA